MKHILIIVLFISSLAHSQKYALIDKNIKLPVIYTDSVSVHQVTQGYFPVEKSKIDTFLANLSYIADLLNGISRSKMKSFELRSGSNIIEVSRMPFAYGDKYFVRTVTKTGNVIAEAHLSPSMKKSNKKQRKHYLALIKYITQNQSLFGDYREIQPKLYNVYVITE